MENRYQEPSEAYLAAKRRFSDFISDYRPNRGKRYLERVESLFDPPRADDGRSEKEAAAAPATPQNHRLVIDINDLQQFDEKVYNELLKKPCDVLPACLEAAKDAAKSAQDGILGKKHAAEIEDLRVGFCGELGYHKVSPRKLLSTHLNQLVSVIGIVTRASLVNPKMQRSVHYCAATKKFTARAYADEADLAGVPTETNAMPLRDEADNPLTTEVGLCKFVDHQRVTMQELPETAPPGQLPRSTDFVLEGDLVDTCKPGDRVMITGVYRPLTGRSKGVLSGQFRSLVVANNVEKLAAAVDAAADVSEADLRVMSELAQGENVLDVLGRSLAPSIYGHHWIKKALVLLLVGGQEKNLANKTHLRGDINCLLVGDPGVAKSQLLRAVMNVAPLAISTNGRGSSGVGLTAAITFDQDTGERRLDAGAVVLGDRGLVCVDEFDKMSDVDRVAIHEVMEQQTVTIAKAGVHTSLNARCSIVAAANPIYGTVDDGISLTSNINLPDSLLSRFDILFVVRDNTDEVVDSMVAEHVLQQLRYRAPGDDGTLAPVLAEELMEQDEAEGEEPARFVGETTGGAPADPSACLLTVSFLRKYLMHAKSTYTRQVLTQEAFEDILQFYVELRQAAATGALDPRARPVPVTARTLETVIRLTTAHSKLRHSRRIEAEDVEVARQLMLRVVDQSRVVQDERAAAEAQGQGQEDEAQQTGQQEGQTQRVTRASRRTRAAPEGAKDLEDPDAEDEEDVFGDQENQQPQGVQVGRKRTKAGAAASAARASSAAAAGGGSSRRQTDGGPGGAAVFELNEANEAVLCAAVNEMLVHQRYVDEWRVDGVQRWLQEHKQITVNQTTLEAYFDRVDQNLPREVPHVLYDMSEKTIHRDY